LEPVLNPMLPAQATEPLPAEPYERSADRQGYRNGTRLHPLMAMDIHGVSTRNMAAITEARCGETLSNSPVSAWGQRLNPVGRTWNDRSLPARRYPLVRVDARVLTIREEGAVRPRAALIAVGVNKGGYREVWGIRRDDSESEASWAAFFGWLTDRGLPGVDVAVSDDHRGVVKAVPAQFQGAAWPRCQTHFLRNLRDAILEAPDLETARLLRDNVMAADGAKAPQSLQAARRGV
jgi:transposase-like protein